jgi:hypothetical protein
MHERKQIMYYMALVVDELKKWIWSFGRMINTEEN